MEDLKRALDKKRDECKQLEEVNHQVNANRVATYYLLNAQRDELVARVHMIDSCFAALGFSVPEATKKDS